MRCLLSRRKVRAKRSLKIECIIISIHSSSKKTQVRNSSKILRQRTKTSISTIQMRKQVKK